MLDDEEYLSNRYEMKQGSEDEEDEDSFDEDEEIYGEHGYCPSERKENYDKRVKREIQILYKDDEEDDDDNESYSGEDSDEKDEIYASNSHVKPLNMVKTNY